MQLKQLFQKKEHKLISTDFGGVVTRGLIPEKDTIILTGHKKEKEAEMRELLTDDNKIYFFPNRDEVTDENHDELIGTWKAEMVKKLGVTKHYESSEEQAKIILKENPECDVIVVKDEEEEESDGELKFIVMSEFGELLDLAMYLDKVEGYEVLMNISSADYEKIGDGIVKKEKNWHNCIGKGYIWVIDGCDQADLQDWLREQGEYVVGTNKEMSELENDRQKGQKWFKEAGFYQPFSKNFTNIDECIKFVEENRDTKFILKQNGSLPKAVNHKSKFDDNIDMLFHLSELKKNWSEATVGKFDCDLMEIVSGMEVAVSAFFNGHDFLRNKEGKIVAFKNHEQKKEADGDLGATTGEMGTLFIDCDEDDELVKEVMLNKVIVDKLKKTDYRGVFDINCIVTDKGIVGLEPTSRYGIPATSYEFIGGLKSNTGKLLASMAKGRDEAISLQKGVGIVQVIVASPFPIEADVEESATSLGEKLWIIGKNGKPIKDFTDEQRKHIHLENFKKTDEGNYVVASKSGYLLTVTGFGKDICDAREKCLEYIKENIYLSDYKYRQDLGKSIEKYYN